MKRVAGTSPQKSAMPMRQGAFLIPAFAVERTQELIVDLIDIRKLRRALEAEQ